MAWRQKVLPAVSAFMWVFPVRLLSLKPQDSALECMLLPRGVPNTGCPRGSDGKESACNAGDMSLIKGRSPGGGNGNPLWYSCLENSTWQATVHEVAKNQTQLSDTHTHTHTRLALIFSSHVTCGIDGHIFSWKKPLASQNFWSPTCIFTFLHASGLKQFLYTDLFIPSLKNYCEPSAFWSPCHFLEVLWLHVDKVCGAMKLMVSDAGRALKSSEISSRVKAVAPHSSTLAWKIPWTEEPGGL